MTSKASLYFLVLIGLTLLVNSVNAADYDNYINVYELKKGNFAVKITNYGATVLSFILPDKTGLLISPYTPFSPFTNRTTSSKFKFFLLGK